MQRKTFLPASLLALLMILVTFGIAMAHTGVKAGNYEIEVGWVDEPAIIGQRNAIVVNVADSTAKDAVVDISKLVVNVTYGGQTKTLTLQPLSEDSKNQYIAPIIPTVAGEYTVQLRGKIVTTDVSADVTVEEVFPTDIVAFPSVGSDGGGESSTAGLAPAGAGRNNTSVGLGLAEWLGIAALLFSLTGVGFAFAAYQKARA